MQAVLALLASALAVAVAQEEVKCPSVIPVRNFQYPTFEGQWYEIGHYRNRVPMIWAEENYCSTANVTKDEAGENDGDSILTYITDLYEPQGLLQYYETTLLDMRPPGQWKQLVVPLPVFELNTFTVLELTDTYALTYRCGRFDNELSYTVQFLSRTNQLSEAVEERLKKVVTELKINVDKVDYIRIPHGNCTYMDH